MRGNVSRRTFLKTGAAAFGGVASPSLAMPSGLHDIDLSFIQLSDTHVSKNRLHSERQQFDVPAEESIRRSRLVVEDINRCSLPYELIVHTGDVAHTRESNEDFDLAQEILQFQKPAYFVPGNHDVGYSETEKYRPAFEERFGSANQAIEPVPGLRFAFFDSQPLDPRAAGDSTRQAFEHLDRILTPAKPTLLFCHVMGLESFYVNRMHEGWPESIMQRWVERMKKGGVVALLAGHFHRDEFHLVHGMPFYLAGPVINFWGRQTCYRHFRLAGGELTYRTIDLEI
jgi:3',5'-cyclic AMP phosphodiesterase CpdA